MYNPVYIGAEVIQQISFSLLKKMDEKGLETMAVAKICHLRFGIERCPYLFLVDTYS
jgi:hypothetical protein